jgi:signal transduction histidine kinase
MTVRTYAARADLGGGAGEQPAVVAEVEDTGPGITDDTLGKVFEPFFTTKAGGGGTGSGLGLCVVRSIVRMHEGSVGIANRPEGGARVVLRFPAEEAAA